MPVKRSAIVLVPLVTAGIAGCASVEREFDGSPTNQVWSALVAAAESPEYDGPDPADRWTVVENEVWIAPEEGRIEIYRRLKRYLHLAGTRPRREARTWRLRVQLESEDPPSARFTARGWTIPAWVEEEGELYFAAVESLLADVPFTVTPTPPTTEHLGMPAVPPASQPAQDAQTQPAPDEAPPPAEPPAASETEPPVDIDDATADEEAEVDIDDLLDDGR